MLVQLDGVLVERLDGLAAPEGTNRSDLLRRGASEVLKAADQAQADRSLQDSSRRVPQDPAMVSAAARFPLDRHMAVALTSHRLLIRRASRYPRRRRTFLAGIPLDTIAQVAIPYSSSGPRKTILLQRHDGLTVRFRIDSGIAVTLEHNFRAT